MGKEERKGLSVVFVHPDLGIGGAERLVVDAALALKAKGHSVALLTSHHQPPHCFPETADGTLTVVKAGGWFPRSVLGRCLALCAYVRMVLAALWLVWPWRSADDVPRRPDLLFVDQISAPVPLLRWMGHKVLFYCHFPDLLLAGPSASLGKRLYRAPLDAFEEWSTGQAHRVLVNSHFTEGVFRQTFTRLADTPVQVLYPTLSTASFDAPLDDSGPLEGLGASAGPFFLSLNRFERKKAVHLAVRALHQLRDVVSEEVFASVRLVVAGGYDARVAENVEHYAELEALAQELGLADKVVFLRSPSERTKRRLLRRCAALLYTPEREHFGIVPLEAAYSGRPVVAVNSGGPLETVLDGETGFLRPQSPSEFAWAMAAVLEEPSKADAMGKAGRRRVEDNFTAAIFAKRLDAVCQDLVGDQG